MTTRTGPRHPEPVPPASQLAVLPFLAAIEGFLNSAIPQHDLRLTLHRAITREDRMYLQQLCNYVGPRQKTRRSGVGRIFPVNFELIGAAFDKSRVFRTQHYDSEADFLKQLQDDMLATGDTRDVKNSPRSWLAVPFLGPGPDPVLVLFGETFTFDFFADDNRTKAIVDMCWGFCRLIDDLEEDPFPSLRNFEFDTGEKVKGLDLHYPIVQKELDVQPPTFKNLRSFNYEASVE
jgi:hypothetical protein